MRILLQINPTCLIPQCDGANPEFAPSWLLNVIPGTSVDSFEQCELFVNITSQVVTPAPCTCPASLFEPTLLVGGRAFSKSAWLATTVLSKSAAIIAMLLTLLCSGSKFGLACDEWRRSQIGSIRMMGTMVALPITGYISDRWGRRVALTISAVNTCWLGLVRSFVNSYEWFITLEVVESMIGGGGYVSCYILGAEKGEAGERGKVDLDKILDEEVGQFARYQIVTLALAALPVIFSAFASEEYIFTTARIPTRCLIPQCDGANTEFAPSWLLNVIPGTSVDSFEQCERFLNITSQVVTPAPCTCPASLFDPTRTVGCEEYVYQNDLSVVYDFGLACDEWRRSQIGSIRMMGTMVALPITGYISDRWGRRVALTISAVNTCWLGLVRSFVNSYEWFITLEVVESMIGGGVTELVGPKYQVAAGATLSTLFAVGQVLLGLISWGVPHWRTLTQVLYAPQFLVIAYFWILSESVRWLMSKGRYEESEAILQKVAKTNRKEISEKSLEALRAIATEAEKNKPKDKEAWLPILVFRSKVILARCCVSPIWWITNSLIYYGMSVNAANFSGNKYLNYVYVAAVGIPGYWTAMLLLDRVGRKPVIICAYWLCAACQFAFAFMPDGYDGASLALYLIGKHSIAVLVTSVYVFTAELYPTKYRHRLFAFSSMVGRLGSITAPLTPALAQEVWEAFPSVLYGSFALLAGLSILSMPETLGTRLPDTMAEAEQLSKPRVK